MNLLWTELVRDSDTPDMLVADSAFYNFFWNSLTAIQRITNPTKATSGFSSLEYNGPGGSAEVVLDQAAPDDHMYFLNTDFFKYKVHTDGNFKVQESRAPVNQDAISKLILFMGNLTLSNSSLQGVLID